MSSYPKTTSFVLACKHWGISGVLDHVDVEPTGDPLNSIIRLESNKPGKPFNPIINAGAITVSSIIPGNTAEEKIDSLLSFMEVLIGKRPQVNMEVFHSEWETAYHQPFTLRKQDTLKLR